MDKPREWVLVSRTVKLARVQIPIRSPLMTIRHIRPPLKKLSSSFLGGFFITELSAGSSPSAIAGRLSVTRFTRSICAGSSTIGSPIKIPPSIVMTSPMLQEIR